MDLRCRIEMLGPLRLVRGDQTTTRFGTHKAAALLAWLALRPGPRAREQIIDVFWPDMHLPAGRNNLSTALSSLRRILEPDGVPRGSVLLTTHAQAGLNPQAVSTDAAEFEAQTRQAGLAAAAEERADLLGRALGLWRGEFQPGNYADWAVREGERLLSLQARAWGDLARSLKDVGRIPDALDAARHRLDADPFAEDAHLDVIRLLVLSGQTAAGRAQARRMEQMWQDEFGAEIPAAARQTVGTLFSQAPRAGAPAAVPLPAAGGSEALPAPADGALEIVAAPAAGRLTIVAAPAGGAADAPGSGGTGEALREAPASAALPFWLGRFWGREAELAEGLGWLAPPRHRRLVTWCGPGGAGKTRLAAHIARLALERLGMWCGFVPLASLSAPEQAEAQIIQSLGLPPAPSQTAQEQIGAFFQQRERAGQPPALLLLDNLEHLLLSEAGSAANAGGVSLADLVQDLLARTSELTIWCTSRRRLGLAGEQVMLVGPLPVPGLRGEQAGEKATHEQLAALARISSVALYLDRARAVRPDFGLTAGNAQAVAAVCRTLEGSPLALELAASWVRHLPPRKMSERLAQGEALPEGRDRSLPLRHRSVSAALEWSWRLLPAAPRLLLARLSVFRGGWTAEDAALVCSDPCTLETLANLGEASLITAREGADGDVRYEMLEAVRQYAAARLVEVGADDVWQTRSRHRDCFAALAAQSYPHMRGPAQADWLARLDSEQDNLRAALEWGLSGEDAEEAGLRLVGTLWPYWQRRGRSTEGRAWLARVLAQDTASGRNAQPSEARGDALLGAGGLAYTQGDYADAQALYQESLTLWRRRDDLAGISAVLNNLGVIAGDQGRYDDAQAFLSEHIAIRRRLGDETSVARSLYNLGRVLRDQGDGASAQARHAESLAIRRRLGDEVGVGASLNALGTLAAGLNDFAEARAQHTEALAIQRRLDNATGVADALNGLGTALSGQGDQTSALPLHQEALALRRKAGDKLGGATSLERLALHCLASGHAAPALRLLGAADALRQTLGCPLSPADQAQAAQCERAARAILGDAAGKQCYTQGRGMTWEQASDYALAEGWSGSA